MAEPEELEEDESELAKSNFLARMNHEMRTPLNAIIGMSTIANTSNDLEKVASCLVKINEASIHLLGMINDLLDMAKIDSGNLRLTNAEFNLVQMLNRAADKAKFNLDAKKQKLILDFDPDLCETIIADQQRLAQVLDNLLSNAIKFTPPEGTITLSVKKLKEDESTTTLEVKVIDTGIGVSQEGLDKLFALFEQADGSITRKYGGTGMGLSISASIVHLMGGEIRVCSEVGKGSCFGFEITVEHGKKTPEENAAGLKSAQDQKRIFEGKTILLAEDVEINREIILSLLEDTGIAIDCAENGAQAVEKYRADPGKYSLILMDIHMPEMDGYEATTQIRTFESDHNSGQPKGIPIIAMTANVFRDDVEKCFSVGMTGHLGKPIEFEELIKTLQKHLQ